MLSVKMPCWKRSFLKTQSRYYMKYVLSKMGDIVALDKAETIRRACILNTDPENLQSNKLKIVVAKGAHIAGATIDIGTVNSKLTLHINELDRASVRIGNNVRGGIILSMSRESRLDIGGGTNIAGNVRVYIDTLSSVEIGQDCMFSSDVVLQAGDLHPIVSTVTKECLNAEPSRIELGTHCWLGRGSMVICSSRTVSIGKGAVLAAMSSLVKSIPDFTIAAGLPAKIVKSEVTWIRSRNFSAEDVDEIINNP